MDPSGSPNLQSSALNSLLDGVSGMLTQLGDLQRSLVNSSANNPASATSGPSTNVIPPTSPLLPSPSTLTASLPVLPSSSINSSHIPHSPSPVLQSTYNTNATPNNGSHPPSANSAIVPQSGYPDLTNSTSLGPPPTSLPSFLPIAPYNPSYLGTLTPQQHHPSSLSPFVTPTYPPPGSSLPAGIMAMMPPTSSPQTNFGMLLNSGNPMGPGTLDTRSVNAGRVSSSLVHRPPKRRGRNYATSQLLPSGWASSSGSSSSSSSGSSSSGASSRVAGLPQSVTVVLRILPTLVSASPTYSVRVTL